MTMNQHRLMWLTSSLLLAAFLLLFTLSGAFSALISDELVTWLDLILCVGLVASIATRAGITFYGSIQIRILTGVIMLCSSLALPLPLWPVSLTLPVRFSLNLDHYYRIVPVTASLSDDLSDACALITVVLACSLFLLARSASSGKRSPS